MNVQKKNVASNRLRNIELRQVSVWNEKTVIWFEDAPSLNLSKAIELASYQEKTTGALIRVQATILDSLLENCDKAEGLQFDVEGSEFQIISGATKTLRNLMPNICVHANLETKNSVMRNSEKATFQNVISASI